MKKTVSIILTLCVVFSVFIYLGKDSYSKDFQGSTIGDLDCDGEITMRDILLIRKYVAGVIDESDIDVLSADIDYDDEVTLKDTLLLRKAVAGITTLYEVNQVEISAYDLAVENGFEGTVLEWLDSLNGADGKDGADGKSAYEIAVENGFEGSVEEWLVSLTGERGTGIDKLKYDADGNLLLTMTDGSEVNLGNQNMKYIDEIYELLSSWFAINENSFKVIYTPPISSPAWSYTSSTFSGWGGSIGSPCEIKTLHFKVRARDKAITKIKVFLSQNDKYGQVLYEEILDTDIAPFSVGDVYWTLPEKYVGSGNESLYFSYNCNQLSDVYSAFSNAGIKEPDYMAVQTYCTNGRLLDSPIQMVNVVGDPCRYLYVEIGDYCKELYVPDDRKNELSEQVSVFLADTYYLTVGDTFQLFYRGAVKAVDPYIYHVQIKCPKGKAFPRYFEWTPGKEDTGIYTLELSVYNNNGILLGKDSTHLVVTEPKEIKEKKNVLCIGDSLTAGGIWVCEGCRRMTQTGGTPAGLGFDKYNFIGTVSKTINGLTVRYEGYGGWTWESYCSSNSPFYNIETGDIDFKNYCEKNGFDGIDVVYILLTWNAQSSNKTDYDITSGHFAYAEKLIDRIHFDYPKAIVRCMGIQIPSVNGGMGSSYGADGNYSDAYGMAVTAFHYDDALEKFCKQEHLRDFVLYGDVKAQFDTEYNMPQTQKPVNTRSDQYEIIGTNGVHPATSGYLQIGDVFYRMMCYDSTLIN